MNKSSLLTFLFNATWQVVLIASLAAIGSLLLRKTSARYRHWLWMIALALSLFIPLLTSSRGVLEGFLSGDAPASQVQPVMPFQRAQVQEVPQLPIIPTESTFALKLDSKIAFAVGLIYFT